MVFVDLSSLRFSSLKSFCAPRHTSNVALHTREPVHALGFPKTNCVFCFLALVFHMDNVSRHSWVASKNLRYTTVVRNQTTTKNILQKSSPITIFMIYIKCLYLLFKFLNKCLSIKDAKRVAVLGKS
jgi:hypothetical protein